MKNGVFYFGRPRSVVVVVVVVVVWFISLEKEIELLAEFVAETFKFGFVTFFDDRRYFFEIFLRDFVFYFVIYFFIFVFSFFQLASSLRESFSKKIEGVFFR